MYMVTFLEAASDVPLLNECLKTLTRKFEAGTGAGGHDVDVEQTQ